MKAQGHDPPDSATFGFEAEKAVPGPDVRDGQALQAFWKLKVPEHVLQIRKGHPARRDQARLDLNGVVPADRVNETNLLLANHRHGRHLPTGHLPL